MLKLFMQTDYGLIILVLLPQFSLLQFYDMVLCFDVIYFSLTVTLNKKVGWGFPMKHNIMLMLAISPFIPFLFLVFFYLFRFLLCFCRF